MTALSQYQRLESVGLWRAAPDGQRRDVTLFFGDATLVIADSAARPLTHWSLPTIRRMNPGEMPALFSPDAEGSEELELDDQIMIEALEKVRATVQRHRPQPGRLRLIGILSAVVVLGLGGAFWLPQALIDQTLSIVPQSKRTEIGVTLLGQVQRLTGQACRGGLGVQAMGRFRTRLFGPDSPVQIVIVPSGLSGAVALPGDIILAPRSLLDRSDDPAVLAGAVLSAYVAAAEHDPLREVLTSAGLTASLSLLASGDLPSKALRSHAEGLAGAAPALPDPAPLLALFSAVAVPATPFALTLPEATAGRADLIAGDPFRTGAAPGVLSDSDWVSLQGICG